MEAGVTDRLFTYDELVGIVTNGKRARKTKNHEYPLRCRTR